MALEHTCHAGPTCYDEQADLDGRYAVEGAETCGHASCQQIEHEWECSACMIENAPETAARARAVIAAETLDFRAEASAPAEDFYRLP